MKDRNKLQTELQETFTELKDKYETTHDELVQIVGHALDGIKYPPLGGDVTDPKKFDKAQEHPKGVLTEEKSIKQQEKAESK